MLNINMLGQYQPLITVLLPVIASVLAGMARQDKLVGHEPWNEVIALVALIGCAVADTALNGHITNAPFLDFMFILAYAGVLMHSPLGTWIQETLQTHVLSLGGKTPVTMQPGMVPTTFAAAMPQLESLLLQALPHLQELAPLLKQLHMSGFLPQAMPAAPPANANVPAKTQFVQGSANAAPAVGSQQGTFSQVDGDPFANSALLKAMPKTT